MHPVSKANFVGCSEGVVEEVIKEFLLVKSLAEISPHAKKTWTINLKV